MAVLPDLPDLADWLDTPLKDFSLLEIALHCDICQEYYDTPMITSCSHSFCSKCIRTCLSDAGKCPSCHASDHVSKLRNNWILQTVVEQFIAARPAAIEVARENAALSEAQKKPGKRKRAVRELDAEREKNNVSPADESEVKAADGELKPAPPASQLDSSTTHHEALPPATAPIDRNLNSPTGPYDNNPEAISSIREKVEAANENRHIEPTVNAGFEPLHRNGDDSSANAGPREHVINAYAGSPDAHLADGSMLRKVPMFEMPQQPVSDVDQGDLGR